MKSSTSNQGFTLLEMLIALALVAILTVLSFQGAQKLRTLGREAQCMSHLRQIGMATGLFAADHQNEIPFYYYQPSTGASGSGAVAGTWFYNLAPYLSVPRTEVDDPTKASEERTLLGTSSQGIPGRCVFTCPAHSKNESAEKWMPTPMTFPTRIPVSYAPALTLGSALFQSHRGRLHPSGYIVYPLRLQEVVAPSKKIWLMDSPLPHFLNASASRWTKDRENTYNYPYQAFTRHAGAGNALFFDGHVEKLPLTTFTQYPLGIEKALLRYFHPLREPSQDE